MKRTLFIIILLLTFVNLFSQNQGQFKKMTVTDWIIYKGDTLTQVLINGDTLFTEKGATLDTLIVAGTIITISGDTIFTNDSGVLDTIVVSGSNHWTKTSEDIANNNTGKVTINGDSTYFFPLPDQATKVGRLATLLTNGELEWASPLDVFNEIQDTINDAGSIYGTWLRDTTEGYVFLVDSTDLVGIGTSQPTDNLHVVGGATITTQLIATDINSQTMFLVAGNEALSSVNTYVGVYDSLFIDNKTVFDSSAYFNDVIELATTTATDGQIKQDGTTIFHTYHELGNNNLFIGQGAGNFTADSSFNIGVGKGALDALTTGYSNTAIGHMALSGITTQINNVAIGKDAALSASAIGIVAIGNLAGETLTGNYAVAIGTEALEGGTSPAATGSIGIGYRAGEDVGGAEYNVFVGYEAGKDVTTGDRNILLGNNAGNAITTTSFNVIIGDGAGTSVTGAKNIMLGYNAANGAGAVSDKLYIENSNADSTGALIFGNFDIDRLTINGDAKITGLDSASTDYGLYYNKTTGLITYDSAGSGGAGTNYWDLSGDTITTDYHVLIDSSLNVGGEVAAVKFGVSGNSQFVGDVSIQNYELTVDTVFAQNVTLAGAAAQLLFSGGGTIQTGNGGHIQLTGVGMFRPGIPVWFQDTIKMQTPAADITTGKDTLLVIDGNLVYRQKSTYLTSLPASALEWSDTTASAGVGIGTFGDIRDTAAAIRADFPASTWVGTATSDLNMADYDINSVDTANIEDLYTKNYMLTTTLLDHTASGLKIRMKAHENVGIGDACFINSDGECALVDADAIASSSALMMATASISANDYGNFLIEGTICDSTWGWTPGALIYITVTGTTGNTLSATAPTGTDDVVQIVGVALLPDIILFKPQLVQIELN